MAPDLSDSAGPVVAMVVNNGIAHDARVLKSAVSLARAGARVSVLGVSTSGYVEQGSVGRVHLRRLPVLPPRAMTAGYAAWAARRRLSRLSPAEAWRRSLPVTAYYKRRFLPELLALRPDVVHVHDVHLLGSVADALRHFEDRERPKVVYDAHEYVAGLAVSGARTQRAVDAWAALERERVSIADRVITVAPAIAERLRRELDLPRMPSVVYNAPLAWPEALSRLDIRRESGVTESDTLLVYSGALSAARGVDTIVRGLARLPDVHAAVVAVPYPHPMAPELIRLARAEGVENRLHFVPPVPSHEVPAYLSGADIAVSPIFGDSPSYDMALPNKLFEYVHAGLPVVTSDIAAMAQFVTDHGLGEVFRAGDPRALAEAVIRLEGHRPVVDTTEIRRVFSWQCQEQALVAVYQELVNGLRLRTAPWQPSDLHVEWNEAGRS